MQNSSTIAVFIIINLLIIVQFQGCIPKSTETLWSPSMPDSIFQSGPYIETDLLEESIHYYTNRARKQNGKKELAWSDNIARIARSHSSDMSKNAYFGHINLKGESATERAIRFGYSSLQRDNQYVVSGLGENLFATHRYKQYTISHDSLDTFYEVEWKDTDTIAREAVDAWLKSTPHRKNLLSTAYTREGIGVSISASGTVFVTQNFN